MKNYITFLIQWIIWSFFSLAVWLSHKDQLEYKWIMFMIFCYFAIMVGFKIIKSKRVTFLITSLSLATFFSLKFLFEQFIPYY
ncbi:hypothetical protein [Rossellomorea sp. BNER]|uniref:hypothetical protein n=1 Tax=Rossellomorea sp. BNER TaxID=2962031 RepID=UPI003AF308BA|nr:hypothetical protein [Rossellomorea sp. BNER]